MSCLPAESLLAGNDDARPGPWVSPVALEGDGALLFLVGTSITSSSSDELSMRMSFLSSLEAAERKEDVDLRPRFALVLDELALGAS